LQKGASTKGRRWALYRERGRYVLSLAVTRKLMGKKVKGKPKRSFLRNWRATPAGLWEEKERAPRYKKQEKLRDSPSERKEEGATDRLIHSKKKKGGAENQSHYFHPKCQKEKVYGYPREREKRDRTEREKR